MNQTTLYILVAKWHNLVKGWTECCKERWIPTHLSPQELMVYTLGRLDPFQRHAPRALRHVAAAIDAGVM